MEYTRTLKSFQTKVCIRQKWRRIWYYEMSELDIIIELQTYTL